MVRGGNRYSTDGSYDFSWDRKFPVDGSLLWPKGTCLQLQRLAFSSHFRERLHIVFLFTDKLVISEQTEPDPDLPLGILNDGSGYRFYSGGLFNSREYNVSSIEKVELGLTAVTMGLAIWTRNESGKTKRIFKSQGIGIPQVIEDVADESLRQKIVEPSPRLLKTKEVGVYRTQLLYRILERQFRKCSPRAGIDLVGEQMPEEDFMRLLK